jgi:type I restriction enzyme S subunit
MAKQLYDYWFVQFDFPDENGKPYKSSGGKMVWNENLKRVLPEGWNVFKIIDLATTYSGGTPNSSNNDYYLDGNIPWINSGELNIAFISQTENYINQLGLNHSSAKLYPQNTILVALYGATAGKVSLLTFEACSNQAVCGVILDDERMCDYARIYLSTLYDYFVKLSTGSARDNISQDVVRNTLIIKPSNKIISLYHQIVSQYTSLIITNQKVIESITKQRDELLPLLMNGQVSVNCDLSHD